MKKSHKTRPNRSKPYEQKVAQRAAAKSAMSVRGVEGTLSDKGREQPPNAGEGSREAPSGPSAERLPVDQKVRGDSAGSISESQSGASLMDDARRTNGPEADEI